MQDERGSANPAGGVSNWLVDLLVAALLMVLGAVVMLEGYQLRAGWSPTGPEAGYFPFYVGLLIRVSSTATVTTILFSRLPDLSCAHHLNCEAGKFLGAMFLVEVAGRSHGAALAPGPLPEACRS